MTAVHIKKVNRQYRLATRSRGIQSKLDGLTERLLTDTLDQALASLGFRDTDEVCFSKLYFALHVEAKDNASRCLHHWSETVTKTLRRVIESNDRSQWVWYRSRHHALEAVAQDVLRRDFTAQWAWQQLELVKDSKISDAHETVQQWFQAVLHDPELPVLARTLLRSHVLTELAYHSFITTKDIQDFTTMIRTFYIAEENRSESFTVESGALENDSDSTAQHLRQCLSKAPEFARLIHALPSDACINCPQILLLGLLELEPALMLRADLTEHRLLQSVANTITSTYMPSSPILLSNKTSANQPASTSNQEITNAFSVAVVDSPIQKDSKPANGSDIRLVVSQESLPDPDVIDAEIDYLIHDPEQQLFSDYGGVLFLFNVMSDDDIEQFYQVVSPTTRSIAWWITLVLNELLELDPDDPVLCVFTDRSPGEASATLGELEAHPQESQQAIYLARRWEQALCHRMALSSPQQLEEKVYRRSVRIELDPGWVSATFRLTELSVEIRHAGLDLDPNHVRWLGRVVKFKYE